MATVRQAEQSVTGKQLARLGVEHCELVEGRIVPVSPAGFDHGEAESAIAAEIRAFARAHNLGRVATGEIGVYTGRGPDTVRGADVAFISHERFAKRDPDDVFLTVAPELIVEVLGVEKTLASLQTKIKEYCAIGVSLVWVIDPKTRRVLAYRSPTNVREFTEKQDLPGDDILPGFSIPVARLFG